MITERQKALLLAIIEEFTDTAAPVGSIDLSNKYNLDVSPATIRNEMVNLSDMGFLRKAHISSGRSPTTLAWRWFINEGLHEDKMHPSIEVEVRTRIFRNRFQKARLVKDAVETLSGNIHLPAMALTEDTIFYAGIAEILEYEEFKEIELLQRILTILENHSILRSIFSRNKTDQKVKVLIGEELGQNLQDCSIVFSEFGLYREERGIIGVFGPSRMRYNKVIPTVKYISDVLSDAVDGW